MASRSAIAAHFEAQARACDDLGSPFTARLCRMLPDLVAGTATGERLFAWDGDLRGDALALRLTGGLHRLVLEGADPEFAEVYPPRAADDAVLRAAVRRTLRRNDAMLVAHLDSPPQTNEVARSAMLLPGLLEIAREAGLPLALNEIGASAGLNLFFDRFRYDFRDVVWGDAGSSVHLAPEVRGAMPDLRGTVSVVSRYGCDVKPVDIGGADGRLRLKSYIWPDQRARLTRLEAAISIAQADAFSLDLEDAAAFVARRLAARLPGQTFVLFHSIMWQYMPSAARRAIEASLREAGETASATAPVAWVRMEPIEAGAPSATLSLTSWPGGDTRHLARCDYHGRWIEML
ncbi:MAG: DUF2332 family protein [Mesorhizobium sp.]|nr:DUF2332 family protein [Mesorhizobium sp.]